MYRRYVKVALICLYACATLQFVRYYAKSTDFYLNIQAYLTGHERLPFQERIFPVLLLRPMYNSHWLMAHFAHQNGAFTRQLGPFYLLSLVSLVVAAIYTHKLYRLLTIENTLSFLVFPVFLFAVMWTYSIHSEADYSYPYDLPSLAFFAAGLYYLYRRSFPGLFAVILIGTSNRETTLFLIGLYVIDSASRIIPVHARRGELLDPLRRRFDLRLISWPRVLLLGAVWVSIKLTLAHAFAHNSSAESFLRLNYNMDRLRLRLLPALLNICGYTLPLVVVLWKFLQPRRFQNYLLILPVWLGVMFCSGVLVETRIYGELCGFSAVALVLIMEAVVASTALQQNAVDREEAEVAEQLAA